MVPLASAVYGKLPYFSYTISHTSLLFYLYLFGEGFKFCNHMAADRSNDKEKERVKRDAINYIFFMKRLDVTDIDIHMTHFC